MNDVLSILVHDVDEPSKFKNETHLRKMRRKLFAYHIHSQTHT